MNTKKILLAASAALVLLAASPFSSKAGNGAIKGKETVAPLSDGQLLVKYTGSNQDGVLFNVQFENPGAQKFWLIIRNDEGDVLYQDQFSDVHFNKTIQFLRDETELHPTFIIRSGKQEVKHSFTINRKVTESIEVTKL